MLRIQLLPLQYSGSLGMEACGKGLCAKQLAWTERQTAPFKGTLQRLSELCFPIAITWKAMDSKASSAIVERV